MRLSKSVTIGYITSLAGTALWLYGYFAVGHQALIDWHTYTPWWIADFLRTQTLIAGFDVTIGKVAGVIGDTRTEQDFARFLDTLLSSAAANTPSTLNYPIGR